MKKCKLLLTLVVVLLFTQIGFSTERLANGSFETGDLSGWTSIQPGSAWCNGNWLIRPAGRHCNFAGFNDITPQDGTFVVANTWGSGPVTPTNWALYQDVAVPLTASATLTWKHNLTWVLGIPNPCINGKSFRVELRDPSNNSLITTLYSFDTGCTPAGQVNNTGWQNGSSDISAFSGQTVRVYFTNIAHEADAGVGRVELDQISLIAFGPTAATVGISGRVMTKNGYGIRNAFVSFADSDGQTRSARTNQFGYYRFDDVEVGNVYVFNVSHKQYIFPDSPQVIQVDEDTETINFIASP